MIFLIHIIVGDIKLTRNLDVSFDNFEEILEKDELELQNLVNRLQKLYFSLRLLYAEKGEE